MAAKRRVELEDSLDFEQYDRDCLELLGWLSDRLKVANDKSYLEPDNINNKGLYSIEFQQDVQQGFQQSTLHFVWLNALLKIPLNSLLKFN